MTRTLLPTILLFSIACSSSGSDSNNAGGTSSTGSGGAKSTGGTGGSLSMAGSNNNGGTSPTGAAGTATGTAGTGNVGTSGGTGGAGGAGNAPTSASVTQWGGDIAHTAHYVAPSLTKANAAKLAPDTFTAPPSGDYAGKFTGEVAAIPLYLAGANGAAGEYIVGTTSNDVYAFDAGTGALVWKHNLGTPLGKGGSMCGAPASHGIVGTPVIDEKTRVIYVAGGMMDGHYEVHALNADTGMEVAGGWPVNVSNVSAGSLSFGSVTKVQIQRSALALVNGTVYVAFGGFCGDQGNYHGWVVGVNSADPTKTGAWATMDDAQGGIWAPGGLASDGNGVFAVTGNVAAAQGVDHSQTDSEEIIRITDLGVAHHDAQNMFFPTEWSTPMNSNDQDFGSSSPTIVSVPSSTPSSVIVAPSKPGRLYFLDATNLGASLGQFADLPVADTGKQSQSVYTTPTGYQSASGVRVAITTGKGSLCPDPVGVNDSSLMSILMQPGATADKAPTPKISWCAKLTDDGATTSRRTPISTNSAGSADPMVWLINGTKLNGFDGDTGAVVFDGGTGNCGAVHYFSQVIVANGHIVAAGDGHLCSWSVH